MTLIRFGGRFNYAVWSSVLSSSFLFLRTNGWVWALLKTAFLAVFKVTCGRVLCVHRDVSVHTLFDGSGIVKNREPVQSDAGLSELEIGWT